MVLMFKQFSTIFTIRILLISLISNYYSKNEFLFIITVNFG